MKDFLSLDVGCKATFAAKIQKQHGQQALNNQLLYFNLGSQILKTIYASTIASFCVCRLHISVPDIITIQISERYFLPKEDETSVRTRRQPVTRICERYLGTD